MRPQPQLSTTMERPLLKEMKVDMSPQLKVLDCPYKYGKNIVRSGITVSSHWSPQH